jgi:hypothetical protein
VSERDEGFLARWSRRKHASTQGEGAAQPAAPASDAQRDANVAPAATAAPAIDVPLEPAPLPPVETLTFESDFTPFMAKDVDPGLKQAALKKLLQDERFNVMDGLDVYIDDYTKPAPIPPEWYAKMAQVARLGDYNASEAAEEERLAAQEAGADAQSQPPAASSAAAQAPPDPAGVDSREADDTSESSRNVVSQTTEKSAPRQ